MKLVVVAILILAIGNADCSGQGLSRVRVSSDEPWSKRIADSFLLRHPDGATYDTGFTSTKWTYEQGLLLFALERLSTTSGDVKYFEFVKRNLQTYIDSSDALKTYKLEEFKLDDLAGGRALLSVYASTKDERYRKAAEAFREQLRTQPRTVEGGFWHKKIYPFQMWLDGLYMAEPFYTRYAVEFHDTAAFNDVARQFNLLVKHARDEKTGLLFHGWDESRKERWANKETGCSPSFWGRAMGWYAMALIDVLGELPPDAEQRQPLIGMLRDFASAIVRYQDPKTSVWFQVVDQGDRKDNYLESSASSMFVYALARGASDGYLDKSYFDAAEKAFTGIIRQFVSTDANGFVNLSGTCRGAGLGGTPYRDGSFDYYTHEFQRTNDPKGVGPFLLAAIEIERGLAGRANTAK